MVHCGHLNHLSMSLVDVVTKKNIPFLYTLHDYWLNCHVGNSFNLLVIPTATCGQSAMDRKTQSAHSAAMCHGIGSGDPSSSEDEKYWTSWIAKRMAFTRATCDKIDLFIAPAQHLKNRFIQEGFLVSKYAGCRCL